VLNQLLAEPVRGFCSPGLWDAVRAAARGGRARDVGTSRLAQTTTVALGTSSRTQRVKLPVTRDMTQEAWVNLNPAWPGRGLTASGGGL